MENKVITSEELERLKKMEEKQKERYKKQNMHTNSIYDRINFTVPAGKKKELEELAKQENKTLNKFISEVMLLTLVNNDVNNALNNNTYEVGNVFTIPDELKAKIKLYSDDVIGYINSAIFEKLELDEQIVMDLEAEQEEKATEKPQIEPLIASMEEIPKEKPKPEFKPISEEENRKRLEEIQALLVKKRAEQDKAAEEQRKHKEEQDRQEQEEREAEILRMAERIRNGEPIEEDEEKARLESIIKSNLPY